MLVPTTKTCIVRVWQYENLAHEFQFFIFLQIPISHLVLSTNQLEQLAHNPNIQQNVRGPNYKPIRCISQCASYTLEVNLYGVPNNPTS